MPLGALKMRTSYQMSAGTVSAMRLLPAARRLCRPDSAGTLGCRAPHVHCEHEHDDPFSRSTLRLEGHNQLRQEEVGKIDDSST